MPSAMGPRSRRVGLVVLLLCLIGTLWLATRDGPGTTDEPTPDLASSPEGGPALEASGRKSPALPGSPSAPPLPAQEGHIVVLGRVIDAGFAGRTGVVIRMRSSDRPEQATTTKADGRFESDFGPPPTSQVHVTLGAVSPSGGVGGASFRIDPLSARVLDAGTITLGEGFDLEVRVVHDSKPVSGARVFAISVPIPYAGRSHANVAKPWSGWSHETVSDNDGRAILKGLATGAVRILVVAEGPMRGEVQVRTDEFESPVVVELRRARDLRIEVVRARDGAPVPGCPVGAVGATRLLEEPWARPVTDENGIAILRNAPREKIELHIAGPDWASAYLKMPRHVPPDVTTFRTEVPDPLEIVVPVEVVDGSMPADGTRVELEEDSWAWWPGTRCYLAREGIIRGPHLVVERYSPHGWLGALARLPDGRTGLLRFKLPKGPGNTRTATTPVVFGAPRSVEVRLTERGTGKPAVGVAVTLSYPEHGDLTRGPMRTDVKGRVRIEGGLAAKGRINLCSNPDWVGPSRQHVFAPGAPADLTEGDASLELQVEPIVDAVVLVRTDGKPGLPPGMEARLFYWPQGTGDGIRPAGLRLDPRRGELRFPARRPVTEPVSPLRLGHGPQRLHVVLTSTAYATETVVLEYDAEARQLSGQVDLVPCGALITRVETPPEGTFAFQLERHSEKGWVEEQTPPLVAFMGEPKQKRYERLRPGRYRLTDTHGQQSSPEVQVHAGTDPAVLFWVIERVVYAEGMVELPAGVDPKGLQVYAFTDAQPPKFAGRATMNGTDFKIRVPAGDPIRIYPVHPRCQPAEQDGRLVVSGPEKGRRLRMVLR